MKKALFGILLALAVAPAQAAVKTDYPRLGGTKYGSPHDYTNPVMQDQLAKLDVVFIDFFPNWGTTAAMQQAVVDIKARNPNIVVLDYNIQESIHNTNSGLAAIRAKLDAEGWWLYLNGTCCTKIVNTDGTSTTNFTNAVPVDANGDRYNTWFAKYVHTNTWSQVPALDGTFTDNFFWRPRVDGDWDRNGSTDSQNDPAVYPAFRSGMMVHANTIKTLMPGKLVTGNIGDWGRPEATVPEYANQLDGGLLEGYIGYSWSVEGVDMNGVNNGWGSWTQMMDRYRKVMGLVKDPKLVVFNMKGNPTDYKTARYGLASALMDNAYFDFSDGTGGSVYKTSVVMFDEYNLAGTGTTGWLGAAIDPPQTVAWQNGVYRRTFANGIALVNPRGNDRTVTIEPGYTRFLGVQDPVTNNGQVATSVTLADRDGLLLKAVPPPPPPPGPPSLPDARRPESVHPIVVPVRDHHGT